MSDKLTVYISQPTRNRSPLDMARERVDMIKLVEDKFPQYEITVSDSNFGGYQDLPELWIIGKAMQVLAYADLVIFAPGWERSRWCRMEREACREYEIPVIDYA